MTGLIILIFLLLHIAFALAIGFWLLMTSAKLEGILKPLGAVFGWLIVSLALLLMLTSLISAIRFITDKDYRNDCPMHRMMYGERTQDNMDQQPCPYGPMHNEKEK